jgi:hypothetical protein
MEEQKLSPQDSLAIISQMIREARQRYEENGVIFMLWGISIALVAGAQFYLMLTDMASISGIPYFALILTGIYTGYYYRKTPVRSGSNPLSRIMKIVWFALGMNLFILGFGFFFKLGYNLIPIILIIQGIGLILSGAAIRSQVFLLAGILTQVAGYIGFFIDPAYQPLLLIGVGIFGLFLPGYRLFRSKKKANV